MTHTLFVRFASALLPNNSYNNGGATIATFTSRWRIRMLAQVNQLPALTVAAFSNGAVNITAPVFQRSEMQSEAVKTTEKALAKAKGQAEVNAKLMGGRLGKLLGVSGPGLSQPDYYQAPQFPSSSSGYDSQSRPLPEVKMTVSVTATWELIGGGN